MTFTLADLRDEIKDDISRTDVDSQIDTGINRAIKHYSGLNFWFNEKRDDFVTIADQQVYTTAVELPTDVGGIRQIEMVANGTKFVVYPKSYFYITDIDQNDTTGVPEYWAWYDNSVYFYPTPDASYTAYVSYSKKYTALVNDGDNNDFTNNAEDLLVAHVIWWLYAYLLDDNEQAQKAQANALIALQSLNSISTTYTNLENVEIQPTEF